jgi:hypothetical protein
MLHDISGEREVWATANFHCEAVGREAVDGLCIDPDPLIVLVHGCVAFGLEMGCDGRGWYVLGSIWCAILDEGAVWGLGHEGVCYIRSGGWMGIWWWFVGGEVGVWWCGRIRSCFSVGWGGCRSLFSVGVC